MKGRRTATRGQSIFHSMSLGKGFFKGFNFWPLCEPTCLERFSQSLPLFFARIRMRNNDISLFNHLLNPPRDVDAILLLYGSFAIQSISPNHLLILLWL